jgi:hypothetical protein
MGLRAEMGTFRSVAPETVARIEGGRLTASDVRILAWVQADAESWAIRLKVNPDEVHQLAHMKWCCFERELKAASLG